MKLFLTFAALGGLLALGAAEPANFRYFRQLTPPDAPEQKLLNSVELDRTVLDAAETADDLRLFSADGRELPFKRERQYHSTTVLRIKPVTSTAKSFDVAGKQAAILVEIPADAAGNIPVSNRLSIETGERNFEKKVSIYGLRGSDWLLLSENRLFFDRNPRFPIANKSFDYPEGRWPKLRVEIVSYGEDELSPLRKIVSGKEDRTEERLVYFRELKIKGVTVACEYPQVVPDTPLDRTYPLEITSVTTDRAKRATVIEFQAGRLPVERLDVRTSSANFSREAVLESAQDDFRATGRIEKISLEGCAADHTAISFAERQLGECKLTIFNGDNPPLENIALAGIGPAYHLVTLPTAAPDRLYYAGDGFRAGDYDLGQTLRGADVAARRFNVYAAGAPQPNPEYHKKAEVKPIGKYVFYVAAGVLVLALVVFIIRNASRIEQEHAED